MKSRTLSLIVASVVPAILAGCGADEIASPGSGGNITINNPPPTGGGNDGGGNDGGDLVTPAAGCPTTPTNVTLTDGGTITGPTGEYRVCQLPNQLNASFTLQKIPGLLYSLPGRVDVGPDRGAVPTSDAPVVLTIEPGVVVFAETGVSWLAVNRGNRIQAVGTAESPIVFTSRDNVLGVATDTSQGQWGGVVLLGRAPVTDCAAPNATPGTVDCERDTEGAVDPARYGGATLTDNSGTIDYVQIRYSGYVLSQNFELQSLTLEGVGTGTRIDHFHSHNSSDDGFEIFGGKPTMRHVVVTGADDDNVDVDTGAQPNIQYVIAVQKTAGNPDSMVELDSANTLENNTPRTNLKLANFTFVHKALAAADGAAMLMRGGADATLVNGVVTSSMPCLSFAGANILTTDPAIEKIGPPAFKSVVMQCASSPFTAGAGLTPDQVAAAFNAGTNNSSTFTASLTGTFINGANETAAVATDPKTVDASFDTTTYVGAVKDANDTWYAKWTCNSGIANFGSASTSCTSLPKL